MVSISEANEHYRKGNYDHALNMYYELIASTDLWRDILESNINACLKHSHKGHENVIRKLVVSDHRELKASAVFRPKDGEETPLGPSKSLPETKAVSSQEEKNARSPTADSTSIARHELMESGFWDEDWYLSKYYDDFTKARNKANRILSPLDYYIEQGWRVGHRPSEKFSYTPNRPMGCNPVTYFLNCQRFEGYHFDENVWIPDESEIQKYLALQSERNASKVVYTCITNNFNKLMQPYCLDPEWDYVCFTDCSSLLRAGRVGVWEIRKLEIDNLNYSRLNRWHKVHPHLLFPDYSESLYIDGNINIISDNIYRKARSARTPILFPRHFARSCAYIEMQTLMASPRTTEENKKLLQKQCAVYEASRFPKNYGLSENNVIYRRHRSEVVQRVMKQWWKELCDFSSRDQASLSYTLWKNDISVSDITMPNIRINYKDFWIVKHFGEFQGNHSLEVENQLTPAFSGNTNAVIMSCNQNFVSYLGVVLTSIVENAHPERTYDIIILESDIEDETKSFIRNAYDHHENVSVRFYSMISVLSQLGNLKLHVDGYVPLETYNKIFLAEITKGYQRIAYIDTDIVVNTDITELCEIELWGKSLGSSRNVANVHAAHIGKEIKGRNFREYLANELGIDDYNQYFQAGIVVLDMTSPRVQNLFSLSVEKLKSIREPVFYDQCIFNSIFYGDVSFFSVGWNHVWYLQSYSYLRHTISERAFFDYARSRLFPKIIHFASKDKPTNKGGWDLAEYFWHYAKNSPYYNEILSDLDPAVRAEIDIKAIGDSITRLRKPRVLVHLHVFYLDQIDYMLNALKNINGCDVEICVTASDIFEQVVEMVSPELPNCRFIKVANVGYDAYPFLEVLHQSRLSNFDYVIKLHTKNARPESRDKVYGIDVSGYTWRNDLVNALLGSPEIFQRNLQLLEEDHTVGSIGAGKYLFSTLQNREENTYNLAEWRATFDIGASNHYFGGTMFMARAYPFERFKRQRLDTIGFEGSQLATGSHKDKAHVFERLFGLVIEDESFTLRGL